MILHTLAADTPIVVLEGILLDMRMKEDLGILVLHCDDIVISDFWR